MELWSATVLGRISNCEVAREGGAREGGMVNLLDYCGKYAMDKLHLQLYIQAKKNVPEI